MIKMILTGVFNYIFRVNNKLSKERIKTCNKCKISNYGKSIFCNSNISENNFVGCGCVLQFSTRVKEKQCPLKKWNK